MTEQQEDAIIGKGRQISDEEIKSFFDKKHGPSSFEKETERNLGEFYTKMKEWYEETISKFLDSAKGQAFLKEHEGENPEEVLEIMISKSNLEGLYSAQIKEQIERLRGKVF